MAVPMNVITCFYFLMSLFNDRIQTKLENVHEAIYDLPWYNYTIKQRKHYLLILQCNQIKMKLRAAGLYEVSLEQFSTLVQNAYSAILVVKKTLDLKG